MNPTQKPSRLKKKILAKYVAWIEAFGFLFIGVIIATMIGSTIYKIDDTMKFTGVAVVPRSEPIELPADLVQRALQLHERGDELFVQIGQHSVHVGDEPRQLNEHGNAEQDQNRHSN